MREWEEGGHAKERTKRQETGVGQRGKRLTKGRERVGVHDVDATATTASTATATATAATTATTTATAALATSTTTVTALTALTTLTALAIGTGGVTGSVTSASTASASTTSTAAFFTVTTVNARGAEASGREVDGDTLLGALHAITRAALLGAGTEQEVVFVFDLFLAESTGDALQGRLVRLGDGSLGEGLTSALGGEHGLVLLKGVLRLFGLFGLLSGIRISSGSAFGSGLSGISGTFVTGGAPVVLASAVLGDLVAAASAGLAVELAATAVTTTSAVAAAATTTTARARLVTSTVGDTAGGGGFVASKASSPTGGTSLLAATTGFARGGSSRGSSRSSNGGGGDTLVIRLVQGTEVVGHSRNSLDEAMKTIDGAGKVLCLEF